MSHDVNDAFVSVITSDFLNDVSEQNAFFRNVDHGSSRIAPTNQNAHGLLLEEYTSNHFGDPCII